MYSSNARYTQEYEAQFCAEVVEHCECCDAEIYPEAPNFAGGWIDGLGYVCFTDFMREAEIVAERAACAAECVADAGGGK